MEPLQVIAAPRRLRILELVWDQELSAGQIAAQFEVSWSAVSQHLRVLKEAGFVVERRAGHQPHLPRRQGRSGVAPLGRRRPLAARPGPGQGPGRSRAARQGPVMTDDRRGRGERAHRRRSPRPCSPTSPTPAAMSSGWARRDAGAGTRRLLPRRDARRRGGGRRVRRDRPAAPPGVHLGLDPRPGRPARHHAVVITLQAENGGTRVVLRHHGLPDDGQRDHHRKGWELYLGRLPSGSRAAIPARTPTPDPRPPRRR